MKSLRRFNVQDAQYFVTVVTYNREPLLHRNLDLFQQSWDNVQPAAWVILPDPFHVLLAPARKSISDMIHRFKIRYSRRFRDAYRPGRVWQNRFWDHVIRNQDDLNRHIDYIHYNPVHHGLVADPFEVGYSSAVAWLDDGFYEKNWGVKERPSFEEEYGE